MLFAMIFLGIMGAVNVILFIGNLGTPAAPPVSVTPDGCDASDNCRYEYPAGIGVGICWDQWFPEAARCMALMGADMLLYPTAIGSEPILECDSMPHWRRAMQGHSAANLVPVIAANRIGTEYVHPTPENQNQDSSLTFYGSSFITDATGAIVAEADRTDEAVITAVIDHEQNRDLRQSWGVFRDRRPELYGKIMEH